MGFNATHNASHYDKNNKVVILCMIGSEQGFVDGSWDTAQVVERNSNDNRVEDYNYWQR